MNKVATLQMVSGNDIEENLAQAALLLKNAKQKGAQLVLLPENFAFMGAHDEEKLLIAESFSQGQMQEFCSKQAKQLGLWLIAGTIPLRIERSNKIRSASLVFDDCGKCVARYDKIHLFDVEVSEDEQYQESTAVEPGNEMVVVDTPVGQVGLTVCYDLRFPELFQALRAKGAEIFSIPAAFTAHTGLAHWQVLLRARAIENLAYVMAANQGGAHPGGRYTYGHSLVVEPWGEVGACASMGSAVITASIDLEGLHQLRQRFPCHKHHRLEGR